jgi:hypothetical protein
MTEGYTTKIIPEQKVKVCSGCDHYFHLLIKSGRHPLYKNNCNHPYAPSLDTLDQELLDLGIGFSYNYGNLVNDFTPNWCPVGPKKTL